MHPLFDAHSHLGGAPSQGVGWRVICGTREADWGGVLAEAAADPGVIPMLGLHPWFVAEAAPGWELRLEALLRTHPAGVGECGLDFSRQDADRSAQAAALRTQLGLARDLGRPVALHAVRAWGPLLTLLRAAGPLPKAMLHAYSGSPETAKELQALGLWLSLSAARLETHGPAAQASLQAVAGDRLLLESDGQAELTEVLAVMARHGGEDPAVLAARTWENGLRCFREVLA